MLERTLKLIDAFNEWLGRCVSWLTLLLVLATFVVVVLRYFFQLGSVALQESLLYLHSLIFMCAAAYALKHDAHVRVDIFYRPLGAKGQAWVNLVGVLLLLLPSCVFFFWISLDYVASAWSYREGSREAGGIDAVYLLKTLLLVTPILLGLQGIVIFCRALMTIAGRMPEQARHTEAGL